MGRLFAPLVGPLTLHENIVWLTVRPGKKLGAPVRLIETAPAGYRLTGYRDRHDRDRPAFAAPSCGPRRRRWLGEWPEPLASEACPAAAHRHAGDPKVVLGAVWATALRKVGVVWNRAAQDATHRWTERRCPGGGHLTVAGFPRERDQSPRSLNLGAELLLQWAGGRTEGPSHLTAHVQQVTGQGDGVYLVDGSGLSYEDRVSPSAFVSYLVKFPATAAGRNFPQLLPANGSGTLRRLNSGFPGAGVVRAKTGTLGRASTLVGYLGRPEGTLLVSLMYNGSRPGRGPPGAMEALPLARGQWGGDSRPIPRLAEPPQLGGEQTAAPDWWPKIPTAADSTVRLTLARTPPGPRCRREACENGPAVAGPFFVHRLDRVLSAGHGSRKRTTPIANRQEHVNEPAEGVGGHDTQQPESEKRNRDGPEHEGLLGRAGIHRH